MEGFQFANGAYSFRVQIGHYRLDLMAGPGASSYTASTGEISEQEWQERNCFAADVEVRLFDLNDMDDGKQHAIPALKDRETTVSAENVAFTYGFCSPEDVADAFKYAADLAKGRGH
jgi:hypothetical protein